MLPAVVVAVIGSWVLLALGWGAAATVVALVPVGLVVVLVPLWVRMVRLDKA
jgi:hypothetical protein